MDQVDVERRDFGDAALVLRHDGLEFFDGPVADTAINRMGADLRRQKRSKRVMRARCLCRWLHHAYERASSRTVHASLQHSTQLPVTIEGERIECWARHLEQQWMAV